MSVPDTLRHGKPDGHLRGLSGARLQLPHDRRAGRDRARAAQAAARHHRRAAGRSPIAIDRRCSTDSTASRAPGEPDWARSNWQSYCVAPRPGRSTSAPSCSTCSTSGVATRRGIMCIHLEPAYADLPKRHACRGPRRRATIRSSCRSIPQMTDGDARAGRRPAGARRSWPKRRRRPAAGGRRHEPARADVTPALGSGRGRRRDAPADRGAEARPRRPQRGDRGGDRRLCLHRDRSPRWPGPRVTRVARGSTRHGTARGGRRRRRSASRRSRRGRRPDHRRRDARAGGPRRLRHPDQLRASAADHARRRSRSCRSAPSSG